MLPRHVGGDRHAWVHMGGRAHQEGVAGIGVLDGVERDDLRHGRCHRGIDDGGGLRLTSGQNDSGVVLEGQHHWQHYRGDIRQPAFDRLRLQAGVGCRPYEQRRCEATVGNGQSGLRSASRLKARP